jgi:hypothetical protein
MLRNLLGDKHSSLIILPSNDETKGFYVIHFLSVVTEAEAKL